MDESARVVVSYGSEGSDTTDDSSMVESDEELSVKKGPDRQEDEERDDFGDIESGGESENSFDMEGDKEGETTKAPATGLADVMAKILNKKTPLNKTAILTKGKTDHQIQMNKRKKEAEEEEEKGEGDSLAKKSKKKESQNLADESKQTAEERVKKKLWEEMARIKPDVLDREKERRLQRIATRGVVQLFNAVQQQQKTLEDKLKEVGSSERKRETVMKSVSKGAFLDMLKGTTPNISAEGVSKSLQEKIKAKDKSKDSDDEDRDPSWQILRDDFMMGAKMKDWDKESDSDEANNNINELEEGTDSSDEDT